jgi:hypothetical protein
MSYLLIVTVPRNKTFDESIWGPFKRFDTALAYQARAEGIAGRATARVVHLHDFKSESLTDWLYERVPALSFEDVIPTE